MNEPTARSRGAIVHEWIESTGGSEKVVDAMARLLPGTDIVCLWDNASGRFGDRQVSESILARTPLRGRKALSVPVVPMAWRNRRNPGYDWAIVSTHQFAHQVTFRGQPADFPKYVYVHTPSRFLWTPELDPRGASPIVRAAAPALRAVDRTRAREATAIAVNSRVVQRRVAQFWDRESVVLYPPVDVDRIAGVAQWADRLCGADAATFDRLPTDFLLGASRLVSYKRLDDVIRLGAMAGLPVVIAGDGPERPRLAALADELAVPTTFLGRVSDELLYALYQRAVAYVFPAIEDFGIMPVEAMAAGATVVAAHVGGTAETVLDGVTGALCDFSSALERASALSRIGGIRPADSKARATMFDVRRFDEGFSRWVAPLARTSMTPSTNPSAAQFGRRPLVVSG